MKRVKQLGSVVFSFNSLFIQEEMSDGSVMGEVVMSAAGSHIAYAAPVNTPYITLDTKQYSWVTEAQRVALVAMWKQIGQTFTVTYKDNTTETVRMAHEKQISFTPLYEGAQKYTAIIPLAKA